MAEILSYAKETLDPDTYNLLQDFIDLDYISKDSKISESFIREFIDKIGWYNISIYQKLSEPFIREIHDKIDWKWVNDKKERYATIIEDEYLQYLANLDDLEGVNLDEIITDESIRYQKLLESFIREFQEKDYWYYVSKYQKLSASFIREFKDKLDWSELSQNPILSEPFIRKFQDKVTWYYVSKYQKLSESFIR